MKILSSFTAKAMPKALRSGLMLTCFAGLSACSMFGNDQVVVSSENQNSRISIIVLHYTSIDFQTSLDVLTKASGNPVSSHYLIPEPNDDTYSRSSLKVHQLVPEHERAWHAGRSYWRGKKGLNDQSIGIEIVNEAGCYSIKKDENDLSDSRVPSICFNLDYPGEQIALLEDLLADILERYPHISPVNIVGHSDIAPGRKVDPGPRFPWQRLANLGFGAWYDDDTVKKYWELFLETPPSVETVQKALNTYGYGIEITGEMDEQTVIVLESFQMHFDPAHVTGEMHPETTAKLFALIEKYMPRSIGKFDLQL